jgi:hypothetical protein
LTWKNGELFWRNHKNREAGPQLSPYSLEEKDDIIKSCSSGDSNISRGNYTVD